MDLLDRIADDWCERAAELAEWVMTHLVNRTDVWGRYVRRKGDDTTQVITAPFRDERGKTFLDRRFASQALSHAQAVRPAWPA